MVLQRIIDQDQSCWMRGRGYRRTEGGAGQGVMGGGGHFSVNVSFIILLTL